MGVKSYIRFFRSFDKFGEPVKVLYKGEDTYRTKMGTFFTFMLYIMVITYMAKKA